MYNVWFVILFKTHFICWSRRTWRHQPFAKFRWIEMIIPQSFIDIWDHECVHLNCHLGTLISFSGTSITKYSSAFKRIIPSLVVWSLVACHRWDRSIEIISFRQNANRVWGRAVESPPNLWQQLPWWFFCPFLRPWKRLESQICDRRSWHPWLLRFIDTWASKQPIDSFRRISAQSVLLQFKCRFKSSCKLRKRRHFKRVHYHRWDLPHLPHERGREKILNQSRWGLILFDMIGLARYFCGMRIPDAATKS